LWATPLEDVRRLLGIDLGLIDAVLPTTPALSIAA
jgi:hypothetical protein